MRILLTGATGFIGKHFTPLALSRGHAVRAVCRRIPEPAPWHAGVEWIVADMLDMPGAAFGGVDVIVNLAAAGVSPKPATRRELLAVNVEAPLALLEAAHAHGVRRLVSAGSFAEYGRSALRYAFIPPDAPLLPTMSYAASKAAHFVTAAARAGELGVELCYLRVFSAFGEGQAAVNFWPQLKTAAIRGVDFPMTAGEQVRDFIAVADVCEHFLHALQRPLARDESPLVWNVGSGAPVSILQFARHWWSVFGATGRLLPGAIPYRPHEVRRFVPLLTEMPGGK